MTRCLTPSIIIQSAASYLPAKCLTNDDLSKIVDTSDEWIVTRTGIKERRIASAEETSSVMGFHAGKEALVRANLSPKDIDLLIVATATPDMIFPSTACLIQNQLGLRNNIPCFDVEAACTGFLYILEIAAQMLRGSEAYQNALLIGADKFSSILDWRDRSTCVLFGDGAGAVVLSKSNQSGVGYQGALLGADGSNHNLLFVPGGGSACPATVDSIENGDHFIKMNGKELFKNVVRIVEQVAVETLSKYNLSADQIQCVIPHQANIRIIQALSKRLQIPMERFVNNLDCYGNTSAASIPIALDQAIAENRLKPGDHLLMIAFGAGLAWASSLVRWHQN